MECINKSLNYSPMISSAIRKSPRLLSLFEILFFCCFLKINNIFLAFEKLFLKMFIFEIFYLLGLLRGFSLIFEDFCFLDFAFSAFLTTLAKNRFHKKKLKTFQALSFILEIHQLFLISFFAVFRRFFEINWSK